MDKRQQLVETQHLELKKERKGKQFAFDAWFLVQICIGTVKYSTINKHMNRLQQSFHWWSFKLLRVPAALEAVTMYVCVCVLLLSVAQSLENAPTVKKKKKRRWFGECDKPTGEAELWVSSVCSPRNKVQCLNSALSENQYSNVIFSFLQIDFFPSLHWPLQSHYLHNKAS